MNFPKFVLYTFLGSFIWSAGLGWAGAVFPPREIRNAMRPFDIPIIGIVLLLVAWYIFRTVRNRRSNARSAQPRVHLIMGEPLLDSVVRRNTLISNIEKARNSAVIAYMLHDNAVIADDALPQIYDKLQAMGHRERIDLLLLRGAASTRSAGGCSTSCASIATTWA